MMPASDPPGHGSRRKAAENASEGGATGAGTFSSADPPEQRPSAAQQLHQLQVDENHTSTVTDEHQSNTKEEEDENNQCHHSNQEDEAVADHADSFSPEFSRSATPTSFHSGSFVDETLSVASSTVSSTVSSSKMTLSTVGSSFYSRRTESEILEEDDDDDDEHEHHHHQEDPSWFTKYPHRLEEFPEEYADPESSSTSGHSAACSSNSCQKHASSGEDDDDHHDSAERFYSEYLSPHKKKNHASPNPSNGGACCYYNPLRLCFPWSMTTRTRVRKLFVRTAGILTFLILVIYWGMRRQSAHVQQAPDTTHFYTTPKVCGLTYYSSTTTDSQESDVFADNNAQTTTTTTPSILLNTFPSGDDARSSPDTLVAHCGDCGACSNPRDVQIYDQTRNTLFDDSVKCASTGLLGGKQKAHECMQDRVGFTEECNECWVENIFCSIRSCTFICMWHGLFGNVDKESDSRALTPCTECDEKMCGPDFITCAGANRRRSGILSDLQRNEDVEVCQQVETGWWNNPQLQEDYQQQELDDKADNENQGA